MKKIALLLPLVVSLTACGSLKPKDVQAEVDYACDNNVVMRVADGGSKIKLTAVNVAGNPAAVLQKAPTGAEGQRYENKDGFFGLPTEWHMKDNEAALSYTATDGKTVRAVCKVAE